MRVCFVNDGRLYSLAEKLQDQSFDFLIISPIGRVSYTNEIEGRSGRLRCLADLSEAIRAPVFVGCETEATGFLRKSVVVADKGKLIGISDMTHSLDRAYSPGLHLKRFTTRVGKAGVVVGEDLYFPETSQILAESGADFLISVFESVTDRETTIMRALSLFNGIPIFHVSGGYSACAVDGRIVYASPMSPSILEVESAKEYHLVETRRRGFFS